MSNQRVQFVQLPTFYIKCTADTQYLTNMRFNLLNNIFSHVEVIEDGEVFVSSCALVRKLPFGNLALAYSANGWTVLLSENM